MVPVRSDRLSRPSWASPPPPQEVEEGCPSAVVLPVERGGDGTRAGDRCRSSSSWSPCGPIGSAGRRGRPLLRRRRWRRGAPPRWSYRSSGAVTVPAPVTGADLHLHGPRAVRSAQQAVVGVPSSAAGGGGGVPLRGGPTGRAGR